MLGSSPGRPRSVPGRYRLYGHPRGPLRVRLGGARPPCFARLHEACLEQLADGLAFGAQRRSCQKSSISATVSGVTGNIMRSVKVACVVISMLVSSVLLEPRGRTGAF